MRKKLSAAQRKGLAAMIACVLFWGFSFISTKIAVVVFPPMSLGMLRFAIALIFLYIIKMKLAPAEKLNVKDIVLLFAAGITGVTLYFFFENNGISLVSASEASIAVSSIPVFILITGWILDKINISGKKHLTQENDEQEKTKPSTMKRWQWVGCFVSIAGVWLVAGVSFAVSGSILGYVYMSGAALSWTAYSFFTKALFKHHSVIFIVFWQSLAGFICFIPFSVIELKTGEAQQRKLFSIYCFLPSCVPL
jgi:drug/metabolite transporter (DMT)-like permease